MTTTTATKKTATENKPDRFIPALALNYIQPSKTNPRKHFDPDALQELANSIGEKGVIEPIVIRTLPKKVKDVEYEIIVGERRYRASKLADKTTIPCLVRELDDQAVLEIQLIENNQREDVHELEEAHGYKRLIDEFGYDVKMLAEKVGKKEPTIYARLKLLNLIPGLQAKFLDGTITAGHAILFARLPAESQSVAGKQLWQSGYDRVSGEDVKDIISVRQLQGFIQNQIQMDLGKAKFNTEDPLLVKAAGACPACPKRTGAEPQLFPEVKKQDLCQDRGCYLRKLDAHIAAQVEAGTAVRLTEDYSNREKKGYHYAHYFNEVKKNSCDNVTVGLYVDGNRLGDSKLVCVEPKCKVHHGKGGGQPRYESTPAEQFENAKTSISASTGSLHRAKLYEAVIPKLEMATTDFAKIAKVPALHLILKMVYSRLDSSVTRTLTKEWKLRKGEFGQSADANAVVEFAKKMNGPELIGLMTKLALRGLSMGFTPGSWSQDKSQPTKQLEALATLYGVKVDVIGKEISALKSEKLATAKQRLEAASAKKGKTKGESTKSQTSAKTPTAKQTGQTKPADREADDE